MYTNKETPNSKICQNKKVKSEYFPYCKREKKNANGRVKRENRTIIF